MSRPPPLPPVLWGYVYVDGEPYEPKKEEFDIRVVRNAENVKPSSEELAIDGNTYNWYCTCYRDEAIGLLAKFRDMVFFDGDIRPGEVVRVDVRYGEEAPCWLVPARPPVARTKSCRGRSQSRIRLGRL